MDAQIRTVSYPNGEIQRVQLVRWEDWGKLEFWKPKYSEASLSCFERIYRQFLVPACPWLFGNMVMFQLPEDMEVPFSMETAKYGRLSSSLTAAAAALEAGVHFRGKSPIFRDKSTESFYRELECRKCLHVVRGRLPITTIIPVGNLSGFLTESERDSALKVNASFFIMDRFDSATVYDHIGVHLGLCVKNGVVENPPLYKREALLVKKDGTVSVTMPELKDLTLRIGEKSYLPGKNAAVFTRPRHFRTPPTAGNQLVIIGRQVAAVVEKGSIPVPASGFVLCPERECTAAPGDTVLYQGMEDVLFGIQVGNSILRDGVKTEKFISRFYNIRHLQPVPYPPSLYPMNFRKSRAARIALGADKDGKPMLLWAEGAGKLRYIPGQDSCGASLSEMAEICAAVGMVNAVNLDGGGSAQLLLKNKRSLLISDRREEDNSECERPVPLALMIK